MVRLAKCVPMMTLCVLLCGCARGEETVTAEQLRQPYMDMSGCRMEAEVICDQNGQEWTASVGCAYKADGGAEIEVLSPERIAGVKAVLDGETLTLEYEDLCLDAGMLSREKISPMACLPRMMDALREGWLLEENQEDWGEVPCLRLTVDQTGTEAEKVYTTLWLRLDDGTPLRGEIAVDGEIILTAEFTSFSFCDTIDSQEG